MTRKKAKLSLLNEVSRMDESFLNKLLGWETPDYIGNNMVHTFRYYQNTALRYFHYAQVADEFQYRNINHVLFNMATGSGKTDLMAGLILYLYQEHDYQNFLFLVNANGVLNKTIDNLTNQSSSKYLYRPQLEIEGNRIEIRQVDTFPKIQVKNTIYLKLDTVQGVSSNIYTQKENSMGKEDYARHKVVILGDEAHHYSASTKKERETEQSWEQAIDIILNARKDNKLLEFTATIDLENKNIYEKYKDKVLYRYELDQFIQDGYSKNVRRIQSSNTDIDNMMNVILLSEYRRRFALEEYSAYIKPVVMFKSQRVAASKEAHKIFNQIIEELTVDILLQFLERQTHVATEEDSETLVMAHNYYRENEDNLSEIVREIKREFNSTRVINANDTSQSGILEKGYYQALNSLEEPSNLYRVIFAVARLTEGWDVLNLFDIVRLSDDPRTSGTRATTMSEAQLIGRGARYYPFILDGKSSYTRRFIDNDKDSLIMETIHYHTINEPQYLKNLVRALDEMNLPTGLDKKNPLIDVKVKPSFKRTDLWKYGKIFYNETVKVDDTYYDSLSKYGINTKDDVYLEYISSLKEVNYKDANVLTDYSTTYNVALTFDKRYINKVMNRLSFYHFENFKKYIPLLKSREEFFDENWLNIDNRTFYITLPHSMSQNIITPTEKLNILEDYFIDLSKQIIAGYSKERGTGKFIGYPIKEYISNYRKRIPNYDTGSIFNMFDSQIVKRYELKEDYYVYDSAIVNLTEKQLIDRIAERVSELETEFDDVYLIRMDENMHRESAKSNNLKLHQFGEKQSSFNLVGFQPDFILYLANEEYMIQIFIEPKGKNIEEEQWKEDLLLYLNENDGEIIFEDEINNIKIKGVKFYTMNDGRETIKQLGEITLDKPFKGLSLN